MACVAEGHSNAIATTTKLSHHVSSERVTGFKVQSISHNYYWPVLNLLGPTNALAEALAQMPNK